MARGLVIALLCALSACLSPEITECDTIDCPSDMVCDGHGGCAVPEQLAQCSGKPDGTDCSYTNRANEVVPGACAGALCVPIHCGNGVISPEEACDDGNNQSGDGCAADCRSDETCGNDIVDPARGEQCDDGNLTDGDGCQRDCKLPRCGDGIKDVALDEECDAGEASSNAPDAPCRPNCQLPRCGDGIADVAAGEVCDDANNASTDGCSGDCKSNETCGNAIVDALVGELCDDGNDIAGDGCSAACRSVEVCGNAIIDDVIGEVCDDGDTVSGDGCSSDCRSLEECGNGIIDTLNEQCDLGNLNSNDPDSLCRTNCKLPACGDAITDPQHGEQCDDGMLNADVGDACRTSCQNPRCGDSIKDTLEVCDDGDTTSGDGCSSDCRSLEVCGNGIIDTVDGEQCDSGTANSTDPNATCRPDCSTQRCGDGVVDPGFGEICDLGGANSNDPDATCRTNCVPRRCGDGVIDPGSGEVCDTGNVVPGDGCSADCKSNETCGNGVIDTIEGEQCDNGTQNSVAPNATCRPGCSRQRCGDNIVDTAFGETCDLGGANSNAADATCRLNCTPRRCGDGVTDPAAGEVCDDGNTASTDGCAADCRSDETCGNGVIDIAVGEECDDDNAINNDQCHNDCSLPRCGDGIVDFNEQCDAGAGNSDDPNAACRLNCTPRRCGDRIVDTATEVCDDGNVVSGDNCSADCRSTETCGNGILDAFKGEACDDGNLRGRDGCSRCKLEDAIALSPGGSPLARESHVLVYDAARRRVVMFGGWTPDGNHGDTWEWDGVSWTQMQPARAPAPRLAAAAAYDPKRKRVVLFGGYRLNYGDAAQDTWEYDGVEWTPITPAGAVPSNRAGAAMAYDGNRGELVMFGGAATSSVGTPYFNETWAWNGTRWLLLDPTTKPPARAGARMAFDAVRGYVLMYGGEPVSGQADNNAWTFDGTNWTDRGNANGPGLGYHGHGMAFDASLGRVVSWSGVSGTTHEWNGVSWTAISSTTPTARTHVMVAYDAARKQLVMFGGGGTISTFPRPNTVLADTWLRTAQVWSGPITGFTEPPARYRAATAYDPLRRTVVLFGGQSNATTMLGDTWEWDGRRWSQVTIGAPPASRAGHVLDFDSSQAVRAIRIYGGDNTSSTFTEVRRFTGSAWALDTSTGRTTTKGATMAYDAAADQLVTFGGIVIASSTVTDETWTWSAAGGWTNANPATKPGARDDAASAYDPVRRRTVLFGGDPNDGQVFADVWEYDGLAGAWAPVAASGGPGPRTAHRMFYNPDAARVTVFGNASLVEDLWEWNGSAWRETALATSVAPRSFATVAYHAQSRAAVAFSGLDADNAATARTVLVHYRPNGAIEACTSSQVDYDLDGNAGCDDDECWALCDPLHLPGTTRPPGAPFCGNGTCNAGEDCMLCPVDCGPCTNGTCGDFHCDTNESNLTCRNDCY